MTANETPETFEGYSLWWRKEGGSRPRAALWFTVHGTGERSS